MTAVAVSGIGVTAFGENGFVAVEVVIDRPCAEVAAYPADPTHAPEWYANIVRSIHSFQGWNNGRATAARATTAARAQSR
jgi:hypothetical protein